MLRHHVGWYLKCVLVACCWAVVSPATVAQDTPEVVVARYVIQRDTGRLEVTGRVVVEAQDGGVLLLAEDGELWIIQPEDTVRKERLEVPFEPVGKSDLAAALMKKLPAGFRVHTTANYLICFNTSAAYAEWVGSLFERLHWGFYNYWSKRGVELKPPVFPLVAIVFRDKPAYEAFARGELGDATGSVFGYYNIQTNRVNMYDLTGVEGLGGGPAGRTSQARINRILAQPAAERTVATIVHEATHQLAYNSGLQVRLADNPFWVSEGLAVFFESPDLGRGQGWRTIGKVNQVNLAQFRRWLPNREPNSLPTLLGSDERFRDPRTAPSAYAEAWALNYFLLKTRTEEYAAYLQHLSQQEPLVNLTPQDRLQAFRRFVADDLAELEADFLKYMRRVR